MNENEFLNKALFPSNPCNWYLLLNVSIGYRKAFVIRLVIDEISKYF